MSIIVNGLSKVFDTQKAVHNISFKINKGEIVGFLGPNGAGKSTTMKMLTTYLPPTSGSASVAGYDIAKQPMQVKRSVGYLPESNPLYYDMYIKEFLNFAGKIHQIKHLKERIEEVIILTGLTKEIKKKIGTLSKGYKQRVGIAQAILHNPEVLILDEPTSGLDPNQLDEIRNLIINIGKDKSVLLSTHIMQEVDAICSRVIIINEGQIVKDYDIHSESNTHSESIEIEFKNPVKTDDIYSIIGNNYKVINTSENKFIISGKNASELKRNIMAASLENNWMLTAINDYNESLENVFKAATKKKHLKHD